MHLEFEVEIDVPDDLKNEALVQYLHKTYHGLLNHKPAPEVCESCGGCASVTTNGVKEPIVNGLHPKCRVDEGYKKNNL